VAVDRFIINRQANKGKNPLAVVTHIEQEYKVIDNND
jgi:hypothetical protein